MFPSHCAKPLPEVPDANAMRFQVTEVPLVKPHITEYRRHAARCSCGHLTCAVHEQQPASPFGPRLMALAALLTGVYHLSRRKAAELLSDLAGVRISVGATSNVEASVSAAVQPAVEVAWERVCQAEVKHTDGTSELVSVGLVYGALHGILGRQLLRQRRHALSGMAADRLIQPLPDRRDLCGSAPPAGARGRPHGRASWSSLPRETRRRARKRSSAARAMLEQDDVFPYQLLDPLLESSMTRGVAHAVCFACRNPNLNSPPERLPVQA